MIKSFKNWPFLIGLVSVFIFYACSTTMPIAQQGGLQDAGYLVIASAKENENKKVIVSINNGESIFEAKAVKQKDSYSKGPSYQLTTGKKTLKITRDNKVLYNGIIILGPQETKIILIP